MHFGHFANKRDDGDGLVIIYWEEQDGELGPNKAMGSSREGYTAGTL